MPLLFITSSDAKYDEARAIMPDLVQMRVDIAEIQSDSPADVIRAKLDEAHRRFGDIGEFIVEDTSLHMEALGGLPGPLVKWFLKAVGSKGLFRIADAAGSYDADAVCMIGFGRSGAEAAFVEGRVRGTIVSPQGSGGFGWDVIFRPSGFEATFAEMPNSQKHAISPRTLALRELAARFAHSRT